MISNVKLLLNFVNFLEEYRDLSLVEWNFRGILEDKLITLLHQQRAYWKQRGSIKWATLGDAITRFFHANATMKHRRNLITQLVDSNGNILTQHQEKADLIWHSFKERMGTCEFTSHTIDLPSLFGPTRDLSELISDFSDSEVDAIVRSLPSNKSLGPDGFNTDFVKKCWSFICGDFYDLCFAFHSGHICLQSINGSYITLVPKKVDALSVADYRPISLLNYSVKIITKILANRLQRCFLP